MATTFPTRYFTGPAHTLTLMPRATYERDSGSQDGIFYCPVENKGWNKGIQLSLYIWTMTSAALWFAVRWDVQAYDSAYGDYRTTLTRIIEEYNPTDVSMVVAPWTLAGAPLYSYRMALPEKFRVRVRLNEVGTAEIALTAKIL